MEALHPSNNKPPLPFYYSPIPYKESRPESLPAAENSTIWDDKYPLTEIDYSFAKSLATNNGGNQRDILLRCSTVLDSPSVLPAAIIWALDCACDKSGLPLFNPEERDSLLEEITYLQMPSEFYSLKHHTPYEFRVFSESGPNTIAKIVWLVRQMDDPAVIERTNNTVRKTLETRVESGFLLNLAYFSDIYKGDLVAFDFLTGEVTEEMIRRERLFPSFGSRSPRAECYDAFSEIVNTTRDFNRSVLDRLFSAAQSTDVLYPDKR